MNCSAIRANIIATVTMFVLNASLYATATAQQAKDNRDVADLDALQKILPAEQQFSVEKTLSKAREDIARHFDTLLSNPKNYDAKAYKECRTFPEGRVYPYLLPAMGYAHLAFRNKEYTDHAKQQMQKLIDLAIPHVTREVKPPGNDLRNLRTYQNHATFLGTLNLSLGLYKLATGDGRYDDLHTRTSHVLYEAICSQDGRPINSYPEYSWNFDTITALASLDIQDRVRGDNRTQSLIEKHLKWIDDHCIHKATGLPFSVGTGEDGEYGLPRGCDLSFRICLMAPFAPQKARDLYDKYAKNYWINLGIISGFAEWPPGAKVRADIDSGPIFMGIGLTPTGMALGTVEVVGDAARQKILALQLATVRPMVKLLADGKLREYDAVRKWIEWAGITIDPDCFAGFLYGDAALFCAITWTRYPTPKLPTQNSGK